MRPGYRSLLALTAVLCRLSSAQISPDNAARIREFYRLAAQVQDQVWPAWSQAPDALILVTPDTEFLTHHPAPPKEFQSAGDGFLTRPRQFSTDLLATFPAFGPPPVIVIGEPAATSSKTSTPWLIVLMHEHFHQLQGFQPGYYPAVDNLGLAHGDKSGMWMLNYPFPYDNPDVARSFAALRDLLLSAVREPEPAPFQKLAKEYVAARRKFFAQLPPDDAKYFQFQLWQEGIARYTEVKVAEAAADYHPAPAFAALADFSPFPAYAAKARTATLDELRRADLGARKRDVVYSFGAAEGLFLDRFQPAWKAAYFERPFSLASFFTN